MVVALACMDARDAGVVTFAAGLSILLRSSSRASLCSISSSPFSLFRRSRTEQRLLRTQAEERKDGGGEESAREREAAVSKKRVLRSKLGRRSSARSTTRTEAACAASARI